MVGRVMVERIEALYRSGLEAYYAEINQMERCWTNDGYVVLKFWMQIDKDEQERRFKERQKILKSSGRLRTRTGANTQNGINMKRPLMK